MPMRRIVHEKYKPLKPGYEAVVLGHWRTRKKPIWGVIKRFQCVNKLFQYLCHHQRPHQVDTFNAHRVCRLAFRKDARSRDYDYYSSIKGKYLFIRFQKIKNE